MMDPALKLSEYSLKLIKLKYLIMHLFPLKLIPVSLILLKQLKRDFKLNFN